MRKFVIANSVRPERSEAKSKDVKRPPMSKCSFGLEIHPYYDVPTLMREVTLAEELGYDQVGGDVEDLTVDEDDAVLEQPRVDVVGTLPPAGLFDDDGYQTV